MDRLRFVLIWLILPLTISLASGQTKIGVGFHKHTTVVLEDMYLVKPIDNTTGLIMMGDGTIDDLIYIDSLDNQNIRLQANENFDEDRNLTLYTNKGIISLIIAYDEKAKVLSVVRETDLAYKYSEEKRKEIEEQQEISLYAQSSIDDNNNDATTEKLNTNIEFVYNQVEEPDFQLFSTTDLVDFTVTNIISHGDYIYIILVINNQSAIDYELSGVVFTQAITARKNRAGQDDEDFLTLIDQILPDNKRIKSGKYDVLCFQLEKFTLTTRNQLYIEFNENNGRRKDRVEIKRNFFNNNARPL